MAVKGILYDHHLTLIGPYTSLQGVFQGPLWYYLLAIATFFTNGDPWGGLVLMLGISMATLFIAFYCMNRIFSPVVGVITLFLFAVSPEAIAAATYTWNPHPMWLLILLYIFIFYAVISGKQKQQMYLWPLVSSMFHFETALGFFLFLVTFINMFIFYRKHLFTKYFFIGIFFAFLLFIPQIVFDFRHQFLMTNSVLSLLQGNNQGLLVYDEKTSYFTIIIPHLQSFYENFRSGFIHEKYLFYLPEVLFILSMPIFIFGKIKHRLSKKEDLFLTLILRCVILTVLLLFLYPFPIRYWFLTGFQTFSILFCAVLLGKLWGNLLGKVILGLLFFSISIYSFQRVHTIYTSHDDGGSAKIKGKGDAVDFIYKDGKGEKFNLLVFTPPVYTDAFDYLVWWKSKERYHYMPGNDKKGTFYLLMEVDYQKPWSYKGWLETVIKDGTIISTKTLPSGLIIQKRYEDS